MTGATVTVIGTTLLRCHPTSLRFLTLSKLYYYFKSNSLERTLSADRRIRDSCDSTAQDYDSG